ncbi:hypothetical protein ON010_g13253 [Phytophthora cinnamomi]|nr:hypothetical protein ON010_g13253 [Phytophthora cinnamomi]
MEGREWHDSKYEEEKERFLLQVPRSAAAASAQTAAKSKWAKRKKKNAKMERMRDAKRLKALENANELGEGKENEQ